MRASFLRAIPRVVLALAAARPTRGHHLHRVEALYGRDAAEALGAATVPRAQASERDLLASYLFEPPAVLADPGRLRSAGPDGTVDIEEHAGIDEEIEATADWVARQVLDGTPLEDIAVLVPTLDPVAGLVAERLARLPWADGPLPVHVAGGLPLAGLAAGARALAAVRALRAHLGAPALAAVLPTLRTVGEEARHLSHGAATDLVWSLGTVGGNPARPEGALDWAPRLAERERDLAGQLSRAQAAEDDPDRPALARRARDLERVLADLRAVRPALEALVGVAALAVRAAPLGALWPALRDFLGEWLLQPGEGPRVQTVLDERLRPLAGAAVCGALTGEDALEAIEGVFQGTRTAAGRFGEPRVYVGTIGGAVGLAFGAVRVIGLAEGHLPSVPREDPVLPDRLRNALRHGDGSASLLPTTADRALETLHALDRVVRGATHRVSLSVPRVDEGRTQREASSVVLEAAAALGRPNRATGEPAPVIPDAIALRRDAFAPARDTAQGFRRVTPLGEAAWHDGVAAGAMDVPPRWGASPTLDLARIRNLLSAGSPGPMDGLLSGFMDGITLPGLNPERPISPSGLQALLGCPHAFLLGKLLGLEERPGAPATREIGQPAYGSLFHQVAEAFYREHGAPFCRREGSLPDWLARMDAIVERLFAAFLGEYPLVGEAVRAQQRERLRRDLHELLETDWRASDLRFVAVERNFGHPTPVELPAGERSLHLRGRIDRMDVDGKRTLVRDLKTGRAHPRFGKKREPDPSLDLQIAIYGLVTQQLAPEWGVPRRIAAAYAYFGRGAAQERGFRRDFHDVLEPAARRWLGIASALLAEGAFPRTPSTDDCTFCAFRPVCGPGAQERAATVLTGADGVLAEFGALKGMSGDDE
ncbi:MAG: PD-(D/E)XK nuclease family protein [Candidatus Rokubacteria bacterium]|nr:PD-(D/E)XK nuclease family protein [Candidatus Rokubacteria bacterium]